MSGRFCGAYAPKFLEQVGHHELHLHSFEVARRRFGNGDDVQSRPDLFLDVAEGFPEKPLPAVPEHGVADFGRDADREPGEGQFVRAHVKAEVTRVQPLSLAVDTVDVLLLCQPFSASQFPIHQVHDTCIPCINQVAFEPRRGRLMWRGREVSLREESLWPHSVSGTVGIPVITTILFAA